MRSGNRPTEEGCLSVDSLYKAIDQLRDMQAHPEKYPPVFASPEYVLSVAQFEEFNEQHALNGITIDRWMELMYGGGYVYRI